MYGIKIRFLLKQIPAITCFLLISALLSSCFDEKKITYFQKHTGVGDTVTVRPAELTKIQQGDILTVFVTSLSPEASSFFNPFTGSTPSASSITQAGDPLSLNVAPGYLVDASGNINLPLIGELHLDGLTTLQARDSIKRKVAIYLKEPIVLVRILNYKISVIGEVGRPGVFIIPNQQITLPEAITLAGDLTTNALKKDIEIIRDANGKKIFYSVDITDRNIFNSPLYFLHANDVILNIVNLADCNE